MTKSAFVVFQSLLIASVLGAPVSFGAQPIEIASVNRAAPVDFDADILPILRANCISCHNKTTTKGDLNIETPEQIRRGGENGPGFKAGKGLDSLFVRAAAHLEEPHMPPKDNKVKAVDLTPQQLGILRQWIDEGAKASVHSDRAVAFEPLPDSFTGIYATAVTRDGQYATCSRGGQISVYHVPTRQLVARLADETLGGGKTPGVAHRDCVPALDFSPDGQRLASGSFREIKIWLRDDSLNTQRFPADSTRQAELPSPTFPKGGFEIDVPATKQHLSVAHDGTIALWDVEKKTKVRELKHGCEINAVAASQNVDRVAISGVTNSVKIWDVANGAMIAELKGERNANDIAARASRQAAFLASETTYRQAELKTSEADLKKLEERVKKVTEDLKSAQAAVALKIKARDEALKAKTEAEKAAPAPINYDVPDAATYKKRVDAEAKAAAAAKKLVDAEAELVRANDAVSHHQIELKHLAEHIAKQTQTIAEAKTAVTSAEQLQKASEADAKKALDAANAQQRLVRALAFSPDGMQLATAADDGQVHLWSAVDGTAMRTLAGIGPNPAAQRMLKWDSAGISVTADDGSRVVHSLASRWTLERTLGGASSPIKDRVNALRFSPDGKSLAAGSGEYSRGGEVTVWNVNSGALIKALPDLHKDSVLALGFSADGHMLATGSSDRVARVLDTSTWATLKSFEGHTNHVLGVSWRAEGRTFATAGADGLVKLWDYASGEKKKNVEGWEGEVTSIQYVGQTGNVLVSSGDKRVRLINDAGAEVRAFAGCIDFMQCSASSDDGNTIVSGGQDGVLRVWDGAGKILAAFPPPK